MGVLVFSKSDGPILNFVPDIHKDEFVETIIKLYEHACSVEHFISQYSGRLERLIPELVQDLGDMNNDFFVIGAVAAENEDDEAFGKMMSDPDLDEDQKMSLLEDWHSEYSYQTYDGWREEYYSDIASVLDYHHMSFITRVHNPFNPYESWIEINNYPIIEVW